MPSNLSDYGASYIAGALFGRANTIPATYYFALTSTPPDPSISASFLNEPTGGGYARLAVANNTTNFNAASGGAVTNAVDLTFPIATADWGVVAWYVICDAATGGNVIMYASFDMPRLIQAGSTASFQAGQLALSTSGVRSTIIGGSV